MIRFAFLVGLWLCFCSEPYGGTTCFNKGMAGIGVNMVKRKEHAVIIANNCTGSFKRSECVLK